MNNRTNQYSAHRGIIKAAINLDDPYAASQAVMRHKPLTTKKPGTQGPRQKNELNRFTCDNITRFNSVISVKVNFPDLAFGGITRMADTCQQSLETRLQQWLKSHYNMNGSKVLSYLMEHPNTPVHTSFLDWCNCHKRWPEICAEAIGGFESQSSIPQTDRQALREYRKAANVLIKKIEGAVFLGNAELEERLRSEYDQLNRHIRQVTDPKGHIKSFDPYWKKAYHRVFTCTAKTLKKLASADQELADYAKEHLITGQQFMWRDIHLPLSQFSYMIESFEVEYDFAD